MPTIKLSDETFDALQEIAEPLIDTPDTVIARLLEAHRKQAGNGTEPPLRRGGHRRRARKGERTPNAAFYGPIMKVLRDAGGELDAGTAVDRVGELMDDRLNAVDRATLKSGEVRWRNTVRFARSDLVKKGKLDRNSPFGTWRLAPESL